MVVGIGSLVGAREQSFVVVVIIIVLSLQPFPIIIAWCRLAGVVVVVRCR